MKVRNHGENVTVGHFIIQKGLNFLGSDFEDLLDKNPKIRNQFKRLVDRGILEIL